MTALDTLLAALTASPLPVTNDATYDDDPLRPGVKAHQQQHDVENAVLNALAETLALLARLDGSGHLGYDALPPGALIGVMKGSSWPARPTARTDLIVLWVGPEPFPAYVNSGTGGMLNNVDLKIVYP